MKCKLNQIKEIDKMVFSIIVPVHNAEKYIERCVQSLINQDEQTQIILVENGSNDNSLEICQSLCGTYPQIELYVNQECGVSAARNVGLLHAHGDVIGFCDSDDYYEENVLSKIGECFQHAKADIVFTGTRLVENRKTTMLVSKHEEMVGASKAIELITCCPYILGSAWNKFFRKELITYISFPVWLTHLEDGYMNIQLLSQLRNVKVYVSSIVTYNYMINDSSASNEMERCFDVQGKLNYCNALHSMLEDLQLEKNEKNSVRDQLYRISSDWFYHFRDRLTSTNKARLRADVSNNWFAFTARVFRYDVVRRIKYSIKGLLIIMRVIR